MRKLRSVGKKSNKKTIRISTAEAEAGLFCEADGQPIDPQELLCAFAEHRHSKIKYFGT